MFAFLMVAGILALLAAVLINVILVKTIQKISNPDGLLVVDDEGHSKLYGNPAYAHVADWAKANGFEPDLAADFYGRTDGVRTQVLTWKNGYKKTFLAYYCTPEKDFWEFVTILKNDSALNSSNTKDSVMLPSPPGIFMQACEGLDLNTLFSWHEQALVFLHEAGDVAIVDRWESTDKLILESIRRQVAHVKSIPLWQFLGVYWFFVRRNRLNAKSIRDRYPQGATR